MKRTLFVGVVAAGIFSLIRVMGGLMTKLTEHVMPNMMDSCFSRMDMERR